MDKEQMINKVIHIDELYKKLRKKEVQLTEESLYYFLEKNKDKELIVEQDCYSCYTNSRILKKHIDNIVEDIKEIDGKIVIYLDNEEVLKIYVA